MGKRRKHGRAPQQRNTSVRRGGFGQPDTGKANVPTAAQGARDATTTVAAMTQGGRVAPGYTQQALDRPATWYQNPFGPGLPALPVGIDTPDPRTGRPEPRIFEYTVGWNLPGKHNRLLPWKLLRDAADFIPLIRRCIGIRQDRIGALDWGIRLTKTAIQRAERDNPGMPRVELERKLRADNAAAIDRCEQFWAMPDRRNRRGWNAWLKILLEEVFVVDALSIYPVRTYNGDLHSLEILDGTTIKPLLDERGGRPQPPFPAFQQILWGFPRRDLGMEVSPDGDTGTLLPTDQLIYEVRNPRVWTPYGYSAVEQALADGELYMHRHRWMTLEYTAGTMPTNLFEVAANAALTPQQVVELETLFNDLHSGDSAQRQRAHFLPPGIAPAKDGGDVGERYKPDYDLHLIKLLASHFDTTLPELGFTESKGLGSSGYHEGQENIQERKDQSLVKWLKRLCTDITRTQLGAPDELEFYFHGLDDEDEAAADDVEQARLNGGVITINERRDRLGLPRYEFDEADMPAIFTQRGMVFLEGAASLVPAGTFITPPQAPPGAVTPAAAETADQGDGDANPGEPEPAQQKPPTNAATTEQEKKAELAAYRKYAAKGRARPFAWRHHTAAEVAEITKAGGGAGPKARTGQTWAGWTKDQAVAEHWAAVLSQAFGGIDTRGIADAWAAARGIGKTTAGQRPDPVVVADALIWLTTTGAPDVAATVRRELEHIIDGVWTDGYYVGDRAAVWTARDEILAVAARTGEALPAGGRATVTGSIDWGAWEPGDTDAAKRVLGGGLQQLLDQAHVTINSVAANRMDDLAEVLAEGLAEGLAPGTIAARLDGVLTDPGWASLVAETETARAISVASQDRYLSIGITANTWMTAEDQRVCPACRENEAAGAVSIGQSFPSGASGPPGHPRCRCALAPSVESISNIFWPTLTNELTGATQ